jgi:Fe2+ or Zn2+ uptake regulation protein
MIFNKNTILLTYNLLQNAVIGNGVKNLFLQFKIHEILCCTQENKIMHFELARLNHNSNTESAPKSMNLVKIKAF